MHQTEIQKRKSPLKSIALVKKFARRPGGLEKVFSEILLRATKEFSTVTLITNQIVEVPTGVEVIKLNDRSISKTLSLLRFDRQIARYLKQVPHDIVLGLDRSINQTHHRAGNGCHAAYLHSLSRHDNFFKRLFRRVSPFHQYTLYQEKKLFQNDGFKLAITNSNMVKDELLHYFSIQPKNIETVPNGVDIAKQNAAKPPVEKNPNTIKLLFVGSGFKRKGLKQCLQAVAQLPDSYTLDVIGHDKGLKQYQKLSSLLGIEHRVKFHGRCNPKPFYEKADIFVLPTIYDPFANTTIEALSHGLYVITSEKNGGKQVLNPEVGNVLTCPVNPESLVLAIKQAPPKTYENYQLRKKATSQQTLENHAQQVLSLCQNT